MMEMTEDPETSVDASKLRASNADREAVANVLHTSLAEGRLTVAELQERLDVVYASKTLAELEPVTRDLPGHAELMPLLQVEPPVPVSKPSLSKSVPGAAVAKIGGTPTSSLAIGFWSGATRSGPWVVPTQFTALAVMGGVDIDLTQATFAEREVTITAVAIMGGIDIVVPDDITVVCNGFGFMGAFEDTAHVQGGGPGGPVVRVNGLAVMGGVEIHRPKKSKQIES